MRFNPAGYGDKVAQLLALHDSGERLIPLVAEGCSSEEAFNLLTSRKPQELFPNSLSASGAMAGLWLYFSCFDAAHEIAQADSSPEGSFWHAILHRQEPDSGNSAYWFERVKSHAVYDALVVEAAAIVKQYPEVKFHPGVKWDPFGFIHFCERAREQPGSQSERAALEIQRAEWQLLFDHCARPRSR